MLAVKPVRTPNTILPRTDILYDIGGLVHALPYGAGSYSDRTPLMHEIREDGIDL
jgi:hypothetical protein